MIGRLTEFRRKLHEIPEVDFDLPETRAYIMTLLEALPCQVDLIGQASLCAFFDAGKGQAVAFRADMDALPISEKNDLPYASRHEGKMHACGHDGHMAVLLAFAGEVAAKLALLPWDVLLVFQAAEETTGGAFEVCQSGVFEKYRAQRVYGLHVWPNFPKETIICRKNEFMAKTCNLFVDIRGKGTHAAYAEKGIDALEAGTRFLQAAYAMERDELPKELFRLLKFGIFQSGTAVNVIADHAVLKGTMRCFQDDVHDLMARRLREIADGLEADTGCQVELSFLPGYPALINEGAVFEDFKKALAADAGHLPPLSDGRSVRVFQLTEPELPYMTGEDFSFYQERLPGLFFHLGLGPGASLHGNRFDFDESALGAGVEVFWRLLFLSGQTGDGAL